MPKTVHIVGTGKSLISYEWPTDVEKWSVASAYGGFTDNIDMYFCMHDKDDKEGIEAAGIPTIDKSSYPLNDIIVEYDNSYLTNSISYMIAYAIFKGYEEIHLPGVDMTPYSEYAFERPSVAFWCGIAKQKGIKIVFDLLEPHVIYGYSEVAMSKVFTMLDAHLNAAIQHREMEEDEAKQHQWTGYIAACNMIKRELQS